MICQKSLWYIRCLILKPERQDRIFVRKVHLFTRGATQSTRINRNILRNGNRVTFLLLLITNMVTLRNTYGAIILIGATNIDLSATVQATTLTQVLASH